MVLDFIEKYKFAIIGTVVFHMCFFIYTNFVTVASPFTAGMTSEEQMEMTIPLDDIPLDPEMMKLLDVTPKDPGQESENVANVTSDANDRRDKSYENFSTQEMDEQVAENTKALEEQYFNEWGSTHAGDGVQKNEKSGVNIEDKKQTVNKNQNSVDKSIDTQGANSYAGDVMASFNLKDRKAHALEKPGYTCNTAGTVTLEIKVSKDGDVQSATYLPDASSNATECMIQQSIKYAKRSRFSYSGTAPAIQTGTITYKFVSR